MLDRRYDHRNHDGEGVHRPFSLPLRAVPLRLRLQRVIESREDDRIDGLHRIKSDYNC